MNKATITSFKDLLCIEMGQSPKSEFVNNDGEGIPLLNGPAEFTSKHPVPKQFTTKGNRFSETLDILFCVRGSTTGRMNIADQKYAIGRGLAAIRHIEGSHLNSFVRGLIEQNLSGLLGGSMGSVFPNLTKDQLLNYKCVVPNLSTQKQIAKVLSDLDAKIEINNKINQQLEAIAKTLYDYWFVQFDFPSPSSSSGQAGKPYKSSGGKMVFNEALKREIPEGWEVQELGDISEIKRGKLVTAKTANLSGKYKVVSAGIDFSYMHCESNRKENTITVSGSGANAGFINFWREPIFANDCTTVRGKTDSETLIILEFLRMRQNYIFQQARGSAQPHVYPKDISILKIAIPNNDLFIEYGQLILPTNNIIANNLQQNQKLSELRDWLLPMLMNGQVTVQEVEDNLENIFGKAFNFDFEIACIIYLTEEVMGNRYGRKYLHKTLSNIQMLASVPKVDKIVFKEYFWGMYSDLVNDTIKNAKHIETAVTPNGKTVFKVKSSSKNELKSWMKEPGNIPFVSEVNQMLALYQQEPIKKRMNSIELLNTVLECINVLDTYDIEKIYDKMQRWEMQEGDYRFKSDKFSKVKVKEMVGFIKKLK